MTPAVALALAVGCAYLLGSLPTGYLIARRLKGVDVRALGSGNVGATNVARVIGKGAGLLVLIVDTLKGTVAAAFLPPLIARTFAAHLPASWPWWCGLAVVAGHDWSCWLQFQGGKGIATSLGVLLGIAPLAAGGCAIVWWVTFAVSRMVSLSSVVASVSLPISLLLLRYSRGWVLFGLALGCIAIIRHNTNIERMLNHKEQKFSAS